MNNLALSNKEVRMTSVEVVEMINRFREMEENKSVMIHADLMKKIRKEYETAKSLGFEGLGKISESTYINSQNKEQPCYSLDRDTIISLTVTESFIVRRKMIEYINTLEEKLKEVSLVPNLLYAIYQGGQDAVIASKKLTELETKPLIETIEVQKPKAQYYDKVLDTQNSVSVSIIAKELGMSGQKLNKKLNEAGIQYKQGSTWLLYAKYQDMGYVEMSTYVYEGSEKKDKSAMSMKWTQKGREFIHKLFEDGKLEK